MQTKQAQKIRSIITVTPRQAEIINRLYNLSQLRKQSERGLTRSDNTPRNQGKGK